MYINIHTHASTSHTNKRTRSGSEVEALRPGRRRLVRPRGLGHEQQVRGDRRGLSRVFPLPKTPPFAGGETATLEECAVAGGKTVTLRHLDCVQQIEMAPVPFLGRQNGSHAEG